MDPAFRIHIASKFFKIFENCKPVKGAKRSVIYDLQKNTFDFIPNDLFHLIEKYSGKIVSQIYSDYPIHEHPVIDEYFEFLLEKEYIFMLDRQSESDCFPKMNMEWDIPSIITNAIIDINKYSSENISCTFYEKLLNDLTDLGCSYIQLRIFENPEISFLIFFLNLFEKDNFSVELIMPALPFWKIADYEMLYSKYSKVQQIVVFRCNKTKEYNENKFAPHITFIEEDVKDESHCGNIHPAYFSVNLNMFTESLNYNSCLNRKVGITAYGEIKNCPACSENYGNISTHSIKEIVNTTDFQKVWNINKDKINICKYCEFRYMCTDCRAFTTSDYEKPVKCTYDPFTAQWG